MTAPVRKCEHGQYIPEDDEHNGAGTSSYCSGCRVTSITPVEKDPVAAAVAGPWLPTIRKVARVSGRLHLRKKPRVDGKPEEDAAYSGEGIQLKKELAHECAAHLMRKADKLRAVIDSVGTDDPRAKAYVKACCANFLMSLARDPQRKMERRIERRKLPMEDEEGEAIDRVEVSITIRGFAAEVRGRYRNPADVNGIPVEGHTAIIPVASLYPSTAHIDVARAIEKLPAEQATAFRARYTAGTNGNFRVLEEPRTWAEAAELAGMSERTAQRRVAEAFATMREEVSAVTG